MKMIKENLQKLMKQKMLRIVSILTGAGVLVGGIVIGITYYLGQSDTNNQQVMNMNQYLEEIVRLDNIVVGISESGSASLNTKVVSLEYAATIDEVYVKAGQYVKAGDSLVLIDAQAQEEAVEVIRDELYAQQLSLEATLLSAQTKKQQAENTYSTQVYTGEHANITYELTLSELENQLNSYDDKVAELGVDIEAADIERSQLYDTYAISTLESNMNVATTSVSSAQAVVTKANEELLAGRSHLAHAQECAECTDKDDVGTGCTDDTYAGLTHVIVDLEAIVTNKEQEVTTAKEILLKAEASASQAQEAFTQANKNYESTYAQLTEQIEDWMNQLYAQYDAKESYETTYGLQVLQAGSTYEADINDYETAQATYANTIAQIDNDIAIAQKKVDDLEKEIAGYEEVTNLIVAPSSGYIMTQSEVGDGIGAGFPITTLADNNLAYIYVSIAQEDIADISVGMDTHVIFDAYDDREVTGIVDSISITPSSGMASSVSYTVTVLCDLSSYDDMVIYEGMTTTVTFIQRQQKNVLVISSKCIMSEGGKQYVKRLSGLGEIEQVEVETGFSDGFDVEILGGLEEGDTVIIESVVM